MGYFMLITGPGTEYVLSEFNHSCCSYSYLNAIRITTLHLDFIPKLLPQWGRQVKLLTLGLASGCTK